MTFWEKAFGWGKPTMAKFAQELLLALRDAGDTRQLQYSAEEQQLTGDGVINLANLFAEHCRLDAAERSLHVQRVALSFVSANDEPPASYDDARTNLRPKIWSRASLQFLDLEAKIQGNDPLDLPGYTVGSHLVSTLVYDLPHSMRSVSQSALDDWGVTYYQAMEDALQNLHEQPNAWAVMGGCLHSSVTCDSYDSSRIMLHDFIRQLELSGEPIAVAPTRENLFVTGEDDTGGLELLLSLSQDAVDKDPRPLSPLPLKLVDGEWEQWRPQASHPLGPQVHNAEVQFLGELYAQQKQLLESLFESELRDTFVASYTVIRGKGSEDADMRSYCVWSRNVRSLLPETDWIMLVDEDGVQASGSWDHVSRIVGDQLQREDHWYPVRYHADGFPSPDQLQQIGQLEPFH